MRELVFLLLFLNRHERNRCRDGKNCEYYDRALGARCRVHNAALCGTAVAGRAVLSRNRGAVCAAFAAFTGSARRKRDQ